MSSTWAPTRSTDAALGGASRRSRQPRRRRRPAPAPWPGRPGRLHRGGALASWRPSGRDRGRHRRGGHRLSTKRATRVQAARCWCSPCWPRCRAARGRPGHRPAGPARGRRPAGPGGRHDPVPARGRHAGVGRAGGRRWCAAGRCPGRAGLAADPDRPGQEAEVDPGLSVDGAVLALGGLGVLVAVLARAALAAWWATRATGGRTAHGRTSGRSSWWSTVWPGPERRVRSPGSAWPLSRAAATPRRRPARR